MVSAFINDGYSESRDFAEVAGLHPAFSIKFRPLTNGEQSEWADRVSNKTTATGKEITIKEFMLTHMIEWSFEEDLTFENIKCMKYPVYEKLFDSIWSYSGHEDSKNS